MPVTRRTPVKKARRAGHPQIAPDHHGVGGDVGPLRTVPRPPHQQHIRHRFHVGQRLRIVGGGRYWGRLDGYCKVVALMPHEGGTLNYRVRSEAENFERIVAEADLTLPGLP